MRPDENVCDDVPPVPPLSTPPPPPQADANQATPKAESTVRRERLRAVG
jgi:hypothetical protein